MHGFNRIKQIMIVAFIAAGIFNFMPNGMQSAAADNSVQQNTVPIHPDPTNAAPDSSKQTDPPEPVIDSERLNQQIKTWIAELAKQKPFTVWQSAQYDIYPLGPGTHGWLVLITLNNEEIGYLIVSAAPDNQLTLSEYGIGSNPLYSINTLYPSMVQQGIIPSSMKRSQLFQSKSLTLSRLYAHPLLAVWKITVKGKDTFYLDAKTGEGLQIDDKMWQTQLKAMKALTNEKKESGFFLPTLTQTLPKEALQRLRPFDPYERFGWLTRDPLPIQTAEDLTRMLDHKKKITFVSNWYGDTFLIPLPMIGYQQWETGETYIWTDEFGSRWIPFQALKLYGKFYA